MTTASEIVRQAFREANIIPTGAAPSADEEAEGLDRLNALLDSLFGFELGDPLQDWFVPDTRHANRRFTFPDFHGHSGGTVLDAQHPPQDARLLVKTDGASLRITFPELPGDGARMRLISLDSTGSIIIDANGRLIEGAASLTLEPPPVAPVEWFYRADLADWKRRGNLALQDESILPAEFDDMLISWLAIRLMSRYGNEPRSGTVEMFQTMQRKFKARYSKTVGVVTRPEFNNDHGLFHYG